MPGWPPPGRAPPGARRLPSSWPVRPQPFHPPDSVYDVLTDPQFIRQFSARPSCGSIGWLATRCSHHLIAQFGCNHGRLLTDAPLSHQARDSVLRKAPLPARNGWCSRVEAPLNLGIATPLGQHQNQSGAKDIVC